MNVVTGRRESGGWGEWIAQMLRLPPEREALRELVALRETLDRLEILLVSRARSHGASWSQIGADLGVTKQTAHRRHRAMPSVDAQRLDPEPFAP